MASAVEEKEKEKEVKDDDADGDGDGSVTDGYADEEIFDEEEAYSAYAVVSYAAEEAVAGDGEGEALRAQYFPSAGAAGGDDFDGTESAATGGSGYVDSDSEEEQDAASAATAPAFPRDLVAFFRHGISAQVGGAGGGTVRSKYLARNWNREFQELLDSPDSREKFVRLRNLQLDFVYAAETFARIIVGERSLPLEKKTVRPVQVGGVAGGEKFICVGILFKYATDDRGLYGSHANSAKSASHDLKGMQAVFHAGVQGLYTPLMAVIGIRGWHLQCVSLLPIDKGTMVYGSADAGRTVEASDAAMNARMEELGRALHLAPHRVGEEGTVVCHVCCDIEGHRGKDGRHYLLDFARIAPPHPPAPGRGGEILYKLFRFEFLQRHVREPLSSDGFSRMGSHENAVHNPRIRAACRVLLEEVVPACARDLDAEAASPRRAPAGLRLAQFLHRHGVNLRFLGDVRAHCTHADARRCILVEAVARTLKNHWRELLRAVSADQSTPTDQPYRIATVHFLNVAVGSGTASAHYWEAHLRPAMRAALHVELELESQKEEEAAAAEERAPPRRRWDAAFLLKEVVPRFLALAAIRLTEQSVRDFSEWLRSRSSSDHGGGGGHEEEEDFEFLVVDILDLATRTQHLNLIDYADGMALFYQALSIPEERQANRRRLLEIACKKLDAFCQSAPGNTRAAARLALALEMLSGISDSRDRAAVAQRAVEMYAAIAEDPEHNPVAADGLVGLARMHIVSQSLDEAEEHIRAAEAAARTDEQRAAVFFTAGRLLAARAGIGSSSLSVDADPARFLELAAAKLRAGSALGAGADCWALLGEVERRLDHGDAAARALESAFVHAPHTSSVARRVFDEIATVRHGSGQPGDRTTWEWALLAARLPAAETPNFREELLAFCGRTVRRLFVALARAGDAEIAARLVARCTQLCALEIEIEIASQDAAEEVERGLHAVLRAAPPSLDLLTIRPSGTGGETAAAEGAATEAEGAATEAAGAAVPPPPPPLRTVFEGRQFRLATLRLERLSPRPADLAALLADVGAGLSVVDLTACAVVDDAAAESVAAACPTLAHLCLADTAVTGRFFASRALAQSAVGVLYLAGCPISADEVRHLAAVPHLVAVDFTRCADIRAETVLSLGRALVPHARPGDAAPVCVVSPMGSAELFAVAQMNMEASTPNPMMILFVHTSSRDRWAQGTRLHRNSIRLSTFLPQGMFGWWPHDRETRSRASDSVPAGYMQTLRLWEGGFDTSHSCTRHGGAAGHTVVPPINLQIGASRYIVRLALTPNSATGHMGGGFNSMRVLSQDGDTTTLLAEAAAVPMRSSPCVRISMQPGVLINDIFILTSALLL